MDRHKDARAAYLRNIKTGQIIKNPRAKAGIDYAPVSTLDHISIFLNKYIGFNVALEIWDKAAGKPLFSYIKWKLGALVYPLWFIWVRMKYFLLISLFDKEIESLTIASAQRGAVYGVKEAFPSAFNQGKRFGKTRSSRRNKKKK